MRTETNLQTGEVTQLEDAPITMPPAPTKQEIIDSISAALQNVLDTEAQKLGYDNINTAVSYADESAVASFQTDGISFRAWRSNVWAYAYGVLNKFTADTKQFKLDNTQYDIDKPIYDTDYAQWLIDVATDSTLVKPATPIVPVKPVQPVKKTILTNMPKRV